MHSLINNSTPSLDGSFTSTTPHYSALISSGCDTTFSHYLQTRTVFVLAGNRISFDTFLALDDNIDRKKYDYIFVEKISDLTSNPRAVGNLVGVKILDDFCLHPNITKILDFLNKQNRLFWM